MVYSKKVYNCSAVQYAIKCTSSLSRSLYGYLKLEFNDNSLKVNDERWFLQFNFLVTKLYYFNNIKLLTNICCFFLYFALILKTEYFQFSSSKSTLTRFKTGNLLKNVWLEHFLLEKEFSYTKLNKTIHTYCKINTLFFPFRI